jgi:hypothetical protein
MVLIFYFESYTFSLVKNHEIIAFQLRFQNWQICTHKREKMIDF